MKIEEKLQTLGLVLPEAPKAALPLNNAVTIAAEVEVEQIAQGMCKARENWERRNLTGIALCDLMNKRPIGRTFIS